MVLTATFRLLYVLLVTSVGTPGIVLYNLTAHATPEWTLQQFPLIHDRDRICSNSYSEQVVRTARRESLDFMIPSSSGHLRRTLVGWVAHYDHGRPHKSLEPGIPPPIVPPPAPSGNRQCRPTRHFMRAKPVLGGLHPEYWLEKAAA